MRRLASSVFPALASAALVGVGAGCGASRPSTADGGGQTAAMRLVVPSEYGRASGSQNVNITATGESVCLTTTCDVKGIRLTFSNASRQQAQLRVLPAVITAGARSFTVPASDLPRQQDFMPSGPFLSTLVRGDFIDALATDRDVTVTFGSTSLVFPYESRRPLRQLLATMREQAPTAPPDTPQGR